MFYRLVNVGLMLIALAAGAVAQEISVRSSLRPGDIPLVHNGTAANIFYSAEDHKVVHVAASHLAEDIERVTGKRPTVGTSKPNATTAVIIGTIGKSPLIDAMVKSRKLDVAAVRGKWESFVIRTVERPMPGVGRALVIAGSDRRGTAFGVFEVSRIIGVSPWYWWADVAPDKKPNLILSRGSITSREPSVKYRGIFINDEDWGLQPWAAKTFEPEAGDIGPKTYAKVFELLLRLKANTLWPAMHEVTRAFNSFRENPKVADDYAIVMGSSHAEPMLRSNTTEWKADKNAFNFVTNASGVTEYWEERARDNGGFENIYTLGMRGIHDSPLIGTKSQAERIPLLEKIFGVQRGLIGKHTGRSAETVPQIFCPYKEVLADYRAGLKVPDDVTIVFPDDNFAYIRQFPTAEEQKRKGGFGIYYHISYLGRPFSYLWLNTTPPSLIWQEMNKAYANGVRNLWIVNVGDIKPGEIGMEFFLQMAYDADRWTVENQHEFLRAWAEREFGAGASKKIAAVMDEYYRLGFQRKPEHLQWYLVNEDKKQSDLTDSEIDDRLARYEELVRQVDEFERTIAGPKKAAFYQLVQYPVRVAKLANERYFAAELAERFRTSYPGDARDLAQRSIAADKAIDTETLYFNTALSNGKWRGMMSPEMNAGQWPSMRTAIQRPSLNDFPDRFGRLSEQIYEMELETIKGNFNETGGTISIEAENSIFTKAISGIAWKTINGLGKTGDSVSVFPAVARTFSNLKTASPSLEYDIAADGGDYTVEFYLLPTQPLVPGNGLRIAFAIDDNEPVIVSADKDTDVSSRKWAQNILDQNTRAFAKVTIPSGKHRLRVFAVDTGIVLDKIVLSKKPLSTSYFGPTETRSTSKQ